MARRSQIRGVRSFRRKPGRKPPRSITLIVCEGETERVYFNAARSHYGLSTAEVLVADNTLGSAPISVVRCAEAKSKERGGYDTIYCVFDHDGHESFGRARARIRALAGRAKNPLPMYEAISIPCFEFWILLHFEQTDAPFPHCDDVIRRVRDPSYLPKYAKADAAIARRLMARMEHALENSEWLERTAEDGNQNPFTTVQHVLRHFAQVAQS